MTDMNWDNERMVAHHSLQNNESDCLPEKKKQMILDLEGAVIQEKYVSHTI